MGFVIDPEQLVRREVRRIASERLDDAVERLCDVGEPESAIHEARKRCKEVRGLARLVAPALGDQFRPFDRTVRDAARQLSPLRDAHALLATFDRLLAVHGADEQLRAVRERQARLADEASAAVGDGDDRIAAAVARLREARRSAGRWRVPDGFATLGDGLSATYGGGRDELRRARRDPTDEHVHEWRKSVKYLWYQMRLLREVAPSVVDPMIAQLDALADALGDDHDLAVLVAQLDAEGDEIGDPVAVDHARAIAREQQALLRLGAFRTGAVVFAEPAPAFVERIGRYWRVRVDDGPERPTGGIEALRPADDEHRTAPIERERKFLVEETPDGLDLADHVELRQGYLVTGRDAGVSVRVRDAGPEGCTLTVKSGRGPERLELERPLGRAEFDAAWPLTEGRRLTKRRYRIPHGDHVVELDVFDGDLAGLVIAEVEFTSAEALQSFTAPDWFGREVTDDGRYANAALALDGRPAAAEDTHPADRSAP
jgi:CYTH domain-containing protein/CHAD domain-containing protein